MGWGMLATKLDRISSLQVQVQHPWVPSSVKTRVRSGYVEQCCHFIQYAVAFLGLARKSQLQLGTPAPAG